MGWLQNFVNYFSFTSFKNLKIVTDPGHDPKEFNLSVNNEFDAIAFEKSDWSPLSLDKWVSIQSL